MSYITPFVVVATSNKASSAQRVGTDPLAIAPQVAALTPLDNVELPASFDARISLNHPQRYPALLI
ncbi:hypothetical protein [Trichocoleus sp. FACHB-262]|uniref:hypothetical protein n=1 Tax=Trichocoleus sp. FACHB-262 TaxID=2692869 RepID=UPI0016838D73|nr:hypothetical protein [Trichocoleus sp. FACHB-262]MBD2124710.1 hypothetical protein [Trichocoleus sp. FACHB-262]